MIRIFKAGSLEHRLFPSEEAIEKLQSRLDEWDGESDLNLAWGPDMEVLIVDPNQISGISTYKLDDNIVIYRTGKSAS